MTFEEIAKYAFIVSAVVAIVAGLAVGYMAYDAHPSGWGYQNVADIHGYVTLIILILGIIVGLVSITAQEVTPFLIAAIALIVVGVGANVWEPFLRVYDLRWLYYIGTTILNYFVAFTAPAAVMISMKSIWVIAKEK